MKKFNEMYVIGIDHGYGNMKTANCCFPTGVMKNDTEPTFVNDLLVWNGKYYPLESVIRSLRQTSLMTRTIMFSHLPLSHGNSNGSVSPMPQCSLPQDYP